MKKLEGFFTQDWIASEAIDGFLNRLSMQCVECIHHYHSDNVIRDNVLDVISKALEICLPPFSRLLSTQSVTVRPISLYGDQ